MDNPSLTSLAANPQSAAPQSHATSHILTRLAAACGWLSLFLAAAILFQSLDGAYRSELSSYPDEAGDYVTALMVRDFFVSGQWAHPVKFAENYYLHYPKVALGVWGPTLPIVGATWMLLFSPSRVSILLLMALITAATATILFYIARSRFSLAAGLILGLALIALPEVQLNTARVMADNLIALLDLLAALAFARFLDTGRARDSLFFGVFASLSILTKGSGVALLLLPPLAILMTRRWELLKQRAFWYPAAIILLLTGPWQVWTAPILSRFITRHVGLDMARSSLLGVVEIAGPVVIVLAFFGIWARVVQPLSRPAPSDRRKAAEAFWVVMAAFLLSDVVFHCLIPNSGIEPRLLLAVAAPLLLFAAAGVAWLADRLPERISAGWRVGALSALAIGLFCGTTFAIPHKDHVGFQELAHDLMAPRFGDSVVLVSSTGFGEGVLISEVAMQDSQRPHHIVLRGTKILSESNWELGFYRQLQSTPAEVMAKLESIPVDVVVLDLNSPHPEMTAHQLLIDTLRVYSARFALMGRYPPGPNPSIEAYTLIGSEQLPRGKIHLEMPYTLGRTIEK